MDILSDKAEGQFKLEDVYEDYGAGMKMTNILRVGEDGETYQFLSPKDWIDIMNADEDEVEGIIDNIINEHIEKYPSLGLKRREEGGVWNYAESKRKHDANINKINDAYARDKIDKKEYWRQIDEEVDRWNEELGKNYDGYNPVIHKSENGKLQVQPQVEASNRNPRAEELDDEQEHQIIQIISNLDDEDLNDVGKVRNILGQELPWTNSVDNAIMKELIRTAKYWKKHK